MKRFLIVLNVLFLAYLTSNGQNKSHIARYVMGDTIRIDTAVCVDLGTYRTIRNYNLSSNEVVESKIQIIGTLEQMLLKGDSIRHFQTLTIKTLEASNSRKDSTITNFNRQFTTLDSLHNTTIDILMNPPKQPFYKKRETYIGILVGLVAGVFLAK